MTEGPPAGLSSKAKKSATLSAGALVRMGAAVNFFRVFALVCALLGVAQPALAAPEEQPLGVDISQLKRFSCPELFAPLLRQLGISQSRPRCGYLERMEREDGTGQKINLAIAVIPPSKPATDVPVVYLHGGPGGDVIQFVEQFLTSPLADSRALILFDQRGWGYTTPHLCESLGESYDTLDNANVPADERKIREAQLYQNCLRQLQFQQVDLSAYGTDATVRDMEAIRKTLKLESWNVYGGSYGTTVALAYMSQHADKLRSVILDATSPPERDDLVLVRRDFLRAHERVIAACKNDRACAARFPNLDGALAQAVETLNREPVETTTMAAMGRKTVKLNGDSFLEGIHSLHYDSYAVGMIPLLVDAARERRAEDLTIVASMNALMNQVIGAGANLVIGCREQKVPESSPVAAPDSASVLDSAMDFSVYAKFCETFPEKLATPMTTPTQTSVPTLIVGGSLDPITPPENGKFVAEKLGAKAQFVEFPFLAHGAIGVGNDCADSIAVKFLNAPDKAVDAACAKSMVAPQFTTEIIPIWNRWNIPAPYEPESRAFFRQLAATAALIVIPLMSIVLWPLAWLVATTFGRRPAFSSAKASSSAVVLTLAVGLLLVWVALVAWGMWQTAETQSFALFIGLPASAWPGTWVLALSAVALLAGFVALTWESWRHRISGVATTHRLVVIAALGSALVLLLSGQLIPARLF